MGFPELKIKLPDWVENYMVDKGNVFASIENRMELVVSLALENVRRGTGGPFAAAVFFRESGELIVPGLNMVVSCGCSIAHAEMVAISLAQKKMGTFDLGGKGIPECELVTSTAPCAMCLGAVPWSGVRSLVCGARDEDARAIGFDEGAKVANWIEELQKRGITVFTDICREKAVSVLNDYVSSGGIIYNSRSLD